MERRQQLAASVEKAAARCSNCFVGKRNQRSGGTCVLQFGGLVLGLEKRRRQRRLSCIPDSDPERIGGRRSIQGTSGDGSGQWHERAPPRSSFAARWRREPGRGGAAPLLAGERSSSGRASVTCSTRAPASGATGRSSTRWLWEIRVLESDGPRSQIELEMRRWRAARRWNVEAMVRLLPSDTVLVAAHC